MNKRTYHRFDIDDRTWKKIKPYLTGQRWQHCGTFKNNIKFINVVVWILITGLPGEIYNLIMENVGQRIKDLLDGKERAFGRNYLRYLKVIKNLNG